MNQTAKKARFQWMNQEYEAYTNGKEYAQGTVYFSSTRVGGSYQAKGSYSKSQERFVNYKAGELDECKAAAKALGFID